MNEEYANAERRRKIADDMAWSSGYAAGRATERAALLAELEVGVAGLRQPESQSYDRMTRDGALRDVLDLIRKAGERCGEPSS